MSIYGNAFDATLKREQDKLKKRSETMEILKAELLASSRGKECAEPYRAVLVRGLMGAIIRIEQPFKSGKWGGCGQWYISTLLEGGISDSVSIDFGQQWQVDSGMVAAIDEALLLLANEYKNDMD